LSTNLNRNLDTTTKGIELRLTGRIQSNEESMERLLTRIASSETKIEIESSRINKSEHLFENNFENINGITSKLKNQQDIIDEMRRMLFARISKVESAVRNNKGAQNAYRDGLSTLKDVNRTMTQKLSRENMDLRTPLTKNSLSKLTIDDNLDHNQYLEHLDQTNVIQKNEYIRNPERMSRELTERSINRNRDMTPTPANKTQYVTYSHRDRDNNNDDMQNMVNDVESLKIKFETLFNKQHEVISQLNQDKANVTYTKLESELMDLKTEMIRNRKAIDEFRSVADSNSFNNKVAEFRQEVDMLFKSVKNDLAGNEFNSKLLELQKDIDEIKNQNHDNKYTKDSKKVKIKQMENLEQVTVEVQRLSDGLNNLFNFTQA